MLFFLAIDVCSIFTCCLYSASDLFLGLPGHRLNPEYVLIAMTVPVDNIESLLEKVSTSISLANGKPPSQTNKMTRLELLNCLVSCFLVLLEKLIFFQNNFIQMLPHTSLYSLRWTRTRQMDLLTVIKFVRPGRLEGKNV